MINKKQGRGMPRMENPPPVPKKKETIYTLQEFYFHAHAIIKKLNIPESQHLILCEFSIQKNNGSLCQKYHLSIKSTKNEHEPYMAFVTSLDHQRALSKFEEQLTLHVTGKVKTKKLGIEI